MGAKAWHAMQLSVHHSASVCQWALLRHWLGALPQNPKPIFADGSGPSRSAGDARDPLRGVVKAAELWLSADGAMMMRCRCSETQAVRNRYTWDQHP